MKFLLSAVIEHSCKSKSSYYDPINSNDNMISYLNSINSRSQHQSSSFAPPFASNRHRKKLSFFSMCFRSDMTIKARNSIRIYIYFLSFMMCSAHERSETSRDLKVRAFIHGVGEEGKKSHLFTSVYNTLCVQEGARHQLLECSFFFVETK